MTQYNSLNVKLSNSQLNKFKSATKNETEVVLRLSSNMIGDNETNFPHKLLLTNKQVSNPRKAFENHSSADIKLSKTQLSKMIQSGGFLGRLLGPLLKTGLSLIKNVIKPLAKSVLIPLGLTAAAQQQMQEYIKNIGVWEYDNINNITTTYSGLLLKEVTETVQNEVKKQKGGFLTMLLGTLGASLLGNLLTGKGINRAGEGVLRAGYGRSSFSALYNEMDF